MRSIKHYRDIFTDQQITKIWTYLTEPNWRFWQASNVGSQNFFWYMDFEKNNFFTEELFDSLKTTIFSKSPLYGKNYSIKRVYANGQTYGLDGEFHIDDDDDNTYTFLYYPMFEWNISWGGETIIIDDRDNPHVVYPQPNRGVMFPSNWIHCGKAPSKEFTDLRITIAYKLQLG